MNMPRSNGLWRIFRSRPKSSTVIPNAYAKERLVDMLRKIIAGNDDRVSRLHDEKGNRVEFGRFLRNAPRAVCTGIGRKLFDSRPQLPWISYDAIRFFEGWLSTDKTVLEFGSGMSTIWYARHAAHVYSVEDYAPWQSNVAEMLTNAGIGNVTYEFRTGEEYSRFMREAGVRMDMVMIDGSVRAACAETAIALVKDAGVIYLDNSDKHSSPAGGDTRNAEKLLIDFAKKRGATIDYFTDCCPCEFFVQQGMLIKLP